MKWPEPIRFNQPVRSVSLGRNQPAPDLTLATREREDQAYQRGLTDGEHRLGEQMLRQRSELQQLHTGVLKALREAAAGVIHDTESMVLELAFEIAQKVIAETPISREIIETNVRAALAEADEATEFHIQLHPEDLALLERHTSDLLANTPCPKTMHFVGAPDIGRGGCLVRTQFGIVDARRESRLARLRQTLEP